jgi:hypothetical protein
MTDQSKKTMEYGREKKSVIRIWTDDQKKLLSYLNVDGWDVTNPSMSEKMKQLVEDKDPQRLRNVVDGWTQDWHGGVSYPALAQFMAIWRDSIEDSQVPDRRSTGDQQTVLGEVSAPPGLNLPSIPRGARGIFWTAGTPAPSSATKVDPLHGQPS